MDGKNILIAIFIGATIVLGGVVAGYATLTNSLNAEICELKDELEDYDCNCNTDCNAIYDVNRNGVVNFQDAGLCWTYIQDGKDDPYGNLLYDVNRDGIVDKLDSDEIWDNRD